MQFYGLRCTLCGWKIPTGGGTGLILPCQAASYKPQYLLRLEFAMFRIMIWMKKTREVDGDQQLSLPLGK
jgi:hypothetical protein